MQVFKSKAFKRIVTVLLLAVMVAGTYRLVTLSLADVTYRPYFENDLKKIKSNGENAEILVFGASRTFYSLVPSVLEEKLNVSNVLICSTAMQPISGSYYYLKEMLKDFHPRRVILDVSWDRMVNQKEPQPLLLIYDRLSGLNKIQFALNCFDKDSRKYLLGPVRYKDNLLNLQSLKENRQEFKDYLNGTLDYDNPDGDFYKEKGYVYSKSKNTTGGITYDSLEKITYSDTMIIDENREYLDKFIELCRSNNIEVELVSIPTSLTYMYQVEGFDAANSWYKEYAEKQGINYLDLGYLKGREDIFPDEYMLDSVHLGAEGANVLSSLYGDLLLKEDNREDISSLFYKSLEELKNDVHRIVAVTATIDFDSEVNEDGTVCANINISSLRNEGMKALYQVELQYYGCEDAQTISSWNEADSLELMLPANGGYQLIIRAASENETDKKAFVVYSY